MSDDDHNSVEKPFAVEVAKQGRAVCKKCKQKCNQGELRIAKLTPNPVGSGKMKIWHHVSCIFEAFLKQRQTTKRIEGPRDVEGWDSLDGPDKTNILKKIKACNDAFEAKLNKTFKKSKRGGTKGKPHANHVVPSDDSLSVSSDSTVKEGVQKDNYFRKFRAIVAKVTNASSSSEKITIFREFFSNSCDGGGFKGDIALWCKLLLPAIIKRVFHLQTKQLVKIFSRVFQISDETMMAHLDQGDVGLTVQYFFERNKSCKPAERSTLTIHEVDDFLEKLTSLSKEEDQYNHFKAFIKRCTSNDLKVAVRLIKHDLRMNAGAKHVFEGLHPDAYLIFQSCRDIKTVIKTCWREPQRNDSTVDIPKRPKTTTKRSPKRKASTLEAKNKRSRTEGVKDKELSKSGQGTEDFGTVDATNTGDAVEVPEKRKSVPSYFENVKLYLESGVTEKYAEWVRYFIAYGGTVLKSDEHAHATHVLHLKDYVVEPSIQCANSARHVIVEWIKDSVEKEALQDYRPYTVRWNPSFKN